MVAAEGAGGDRAGQAVRRVAGAVRPAGRTSSAHGPSGAPSGTGTLPQARRGGLAVHRRLDHVVEAEEAGDELGGGALPDLQRGARLGDRGRRA